MYVYALAVYAQVGVCRRQTKDLGFILLRDAVLPSAR